MANRTAVVDVSQQTAAKIAALAYLVPVALVVYSNFGVRGQLFVRSDMAETVRRIAAAPALLRLSITLDLLYCLGVIVLLAALYVVLSPVNRYLALLASLWKLMYAATAVLMVVSFLTVLRLAGDPWYVQTLGAQPLHGLVRLNYSATATEYYVGLAFWGCSSTVIGWLWLKSRYIPAPLAAVGLVSSAWCALCTFAYILDPAFARTVNPWWFDFPMALFDIALSVWLLVKGLSGVTARRSPSDARA